MRDTACFCGTNFGERTERAPRLAAGNADRLAQLHQPLREKRGLRARGVNGIQSGRKRALGCLLRYIGIRAEQPHANAKHVAIHGRGGLAEGHRGDRARRIITNARNRAKLGLGARQCAAEALHHLQSALF